MRYTAYLILILALVMAACGGDNGDSGSPVPSPTPLSDEALTFQAEMVEVLTDETALPPLATQTPASESALVIALPGTLVASETEDPDPRGPFDYIYMQQQGGRENTTIIIEIYGDGRVTRDGMEGRISPDQIAGLNEAINTLNFFGMQGTLLGPPGGEDTYTYRVSIQRGAQARTVNAQDGYMPDEFIQLLGLIRRAGDSVSP